MRGAVLASLAFLPGLCETAQDPSKGVPPEIWRLRQVMEAEVTKDARGEYVSPEQAERFRDAVDDVAMYRNVLGADAGAEVVYLLPRTWQWPQREGLRDLIVLLGCAKGGAVLEAEESPGPGTRFRKAVFVYLFNGKNGLHTRTRAMPAPERAAAIVAEAKSGAWGAPQFGWRSDLLWQYGAMTLAGDPASGVPELGLLVADGGTLRPWALTTLARMDDPAAARALETFYGPSGPDDDEGALAAAFRFCSTIVPWPPESEPAVLVPGPLLPLRPAAGQAVATDADAWAARAGDALRFRLGVGGESLGRKAFVRDGDRASVLLAEVVNRRPGNADGPFAETWLHVRLRKVAGSWAATRWNRGGP
ncbi:MAG: hypothetical protein IT452_19240 [Planctomycetia bacterium]|nr:hypothetical protein [Planctomycetia bacterium]